MRDFINCIHDCISVSKLLSDHIDGLGDNCFFDAFSNLGEENLHESHHFFGRNVLHGFIELSFEIAVAQRFASGRCASSLVAVFC
jgi:hypothetical protein